jgi:hypothetical protein
MKIDPTIKQALEACGAPWELKKGGHHWKIVINGRLAGVLPLRGGGTPIPRRLQNTLAQIRRAARGEH